MWDQRSERGVLAVDHVGAGSLYVSAVPNGVVFASEIAALTPLLPDAPRPNRGAVARWLADGELARGETLLRGVERVEGGTFVRLAANRCSRQRYWRPQPAALVVDAETDERLRAAVLRASARRLRGAGTAGVLLSGGLDSTLLASIGRRKRPDLAAYSAIFPNHRATDESARIAATVRELGLPSGRVSFEGGGLLAPALRYVSTWALPPSSPTLFFHEPLLELARTEGVDLLLDGQGGDELFGLAPFLVADRLRHGAVWSARTLSRGLAGPTATDAAVRRALREYGVKGALPHASHVLSRVVRGSTSRAPAWLAPEVVAAWAEASDPWAWKRLPGERWWAQLAYALTTHRELTGAHEFLRHMYAGAGVAGAHPFLDDVDLIELVLRLPPEPGFAAELDRPLVRSAFAGDLPAEIRVRPDKSYFNEVFVDSLGRDSAGLERLLGPGALVRSYIKDDDLDGLLGRPAVERPFGEAWLSWRLASMECWLRELDRPGFALGALDSWELAGSRYELVPSR